MSRSTQSALKAETPKPFFFRLKGPDAPEQEERINAVCREHSTDRNDLARTALLREVARLEAKSSPVDAATQKIVAEAQRLGVDVKSVLKREIKAA